MNLDVIDQHDLFPDCRSRPEDDTDTRYTPREVVQQLHARFRFTVDASSALDAPSSHVIGRMWSKLEDGLAKSWSQESVFCNPPWSDIRPWVEKAWREMGSGCELVVMLLPTWTDRAWWQELVEPFRDGRQMLIRGVSLTTEHLPRMAFGWPGNPEAKGVVNPPFWTTLLIWRRT